MPSGGSTSAGLACLPGCRSCWESGGSPKSRCRTIVLFWNLTWDVLWVRLLTVLQHQEQNLWSSFCSTLSQSWQFLQELFEKISHYSSKCAAAERFVGDDCNQFTIIFLFKINNNVSLLPDSNWEIRRSACTNVTSPCHQEYCFAVSGTVGSCVRSARKGSHTAFNGSHQPALCFIGR